MPKNLTLENGDSESRTKYVNLIRVYALCFGDL